MTEIKLKRIDKTTWEIPQSGAMKAPGRIIASEKLLDSMLRDKAAEQIANVACLPGIVGYSWAMPDAHWGYGFPIGGVAATDPEQGGVISPGGVGYDINCGVRLMTTHLEFTEIRDKLNLLVNALYRDIPCGVGSEGAIPKLDAHAMRSVLENGSRWATQHGFGTDADLDATEDSGCLEGADAQTLSKRAIARGDNQLGTLGSGNHFAEIGVVDQVFNANIAEVYGLFEGGITFMIHSGSRGLGYQVCDDSLHTMLQAASKYKITLPDKQLCCAPVNSPEGQQYLAAMAAAANYAWANRQIMMELARLSFQQVLGISPRDLGAHLLYDVAHNIAKFEEHLVNGEFKRLCVHRKGATRAFPGSRKEVHERYRSVGQPVLIPGDMGTGSYVCAGNDTALEKTFGSCCHGAGRQMSRTAASKGRSAGDLLDELSARGIVVMARSKRTLTEESPEAYKNIDTIADVVRQSGIARVVARIRPIGVIKG